MKKIAQIIIATYLVVTTTETLLARTQKIIKKNLESNQIFTAENKATGIYYPQDKTAVLEETKYIHVIAIKKNELNKKSVQKLKKNKMYLGSFIDKQSGSIYYIYGIIKNPKPFDDSPDSDVLTQIAINMDYGPGE